MFEIVGLADFFKLADVFAVFLPDIIKSLILCKIQAEAIIVVHKEYNLILLGIVTETNISDDSPMFRVGKFRRVTPRNFVSRGGLNLNNRILFDQIQELFQVRLF